VYKLFEVFITFKLIKPLFYYYSRKFKKIEKINFKIPINTNGAFIFQFTNKGLVAIIKEIRTDRKENYLKGNKF
jgi:hypothetical protein